MRFFNPFSTEEIDSLSRMCVAYGDENLRSAAGLLALADTGIVCSDDLVDELAVIAESHGLSPDEMNTLLCRLEPKLGNSI